MVREPKEQQGIITSDVNMKKTHCGRQAIVLQSTGSMLQDFLDRCTSCGACTSACSFLGQRGTPDRLIAHHDPDVFLCTGCGACADLCPEGLLPSDALLQAKHRMIEAGQVPDRVLKAVHAARRYVRWGQSFPFAYYSRSDTIFWPGCSLAGMSPEVVHKTLQLLTEKLGKKVGIALDCCSDPAYQIGDLATVRRGSLRVKKALEQQGTTSIIAACTNCIKVFSKYLPGVRVNHVLEVLPHAAVKSLAGKEYYLHHPCPTYRFVAVQAGARSHLSKLGVGVVEQTRPRCCGFGGNVHALSTELADASTDEIMAAAGNATIVTYCMACKDRFLSKGGKAYHILELLVSTTPATRPLSSARKWFNRFILRLTRSLPGSGHYLGP
jgi:Fe-S oxidoreductase